MERKNNRICYYCCTLQPLVIQYISSLVYDLFFDINRYSEQAVFDMYDIACFCLFAIHFLFDHVKSVLNVHYSLISLTVSPFAFNIRTVRLMGFSSINTPPFSKAISRACEQTALLRLNDNDILSSAFDIFSAWHIFFLASVSCNTIFLIMLFSI